MSTPLLTRHGFAMPGFPIRTTGFPCIFSVGRHILICTSLTKEVRQMQEHEEHTPSRPDAAPREDVDDLIFRADPDWLASDR